MRKLSQRKRAPILKGYSMDLNLSSCSLKAALHHQAKQNSKAIKAGSPSQKTVTAAIIY